MRTSDAVEVRKIGMRKAGDPFGGDRGNRQSLSKMLQLAAWIFIGAVPLITASGCLATRSWVDARIKPTDAKADRALAGLQGLHLERRLVLDSSHGPTFAFGSATLTPTAKHEIDGFIQDLQGANGGVPESKRLFVIAGHTDNIGGDTYNYELGRERADGVAGYMVAQEGVDPTQVRVVSYGKSKPIADNATSSGRRSNRRVEILLYEETIASSGS